jgi:hypothetical protein
LRIVSRVEIICEGSILEFGGEEICE